MEWLKNSTHTVPFWSLFQRIKRTGFGNEELLSVYRDYGVIRKSDRDDNNNRPGSNLNDYQLVERDDLVLNKMKTWQGSLGISTYRGIVSPAYFVYKPLTDNDNRYLNYVLRSQVHIEFYAVFSKGIRVNQWDLQPEYLNQMPVFVPSLDTQRRIADYLDAETAQIDAMMAKLDEQVGLLRERRGAVLGHAMDQSGLPTTTIGKVAEVTLGKAINSKAETEGAMKFPYVRAANIQPHGVFFEEWKEMPFFKGELERYSLNEDDVLVVEGGAGFGRSLTLKQDLPETGFQNHVLRIRARENYIGQFIDYTVRYHLASGLIELMSVGATIPGLSSEKARALPIAHISLDEQRRIVAELEEKTSRMDAMITKCEELKTLLQERRAALITAVVTGQKEVPSHD